MGTTQASSQLAKSLARILNLAPATARRYVLQAQAIADAKNADEIAEDNGVIWTVTDVLMVCLSNGLNSSQESYLRNRVDCPVCGHARHDRPNGSCTECSNGYCEVPA